jgi:pimeloyl-ACP methyl ester carboxylesterase
MTAVPLVCLHGLAGSSRWWRLVAPELEATGPVELLDLPPSLPPTALTDWVASSIRGRDGPVDLGGHSLGALVAVQVASLHPHLVRRLVLVAPPGLQPRGASVRLVWPLVVSLRQTGPRFLVRVTSDALRSGPRHILRGGAYVATADVSADLPAVAAPTLLVWGERDRLVPVAAGRVWEALLPRARLVVLPGVGHVPMVEAPEALVAAVAAFREEPLDEPRDDVRV